MCIRDSHGIAGIVENDDAGDSAGDDTGRRQGQHAGAGRQHGRGGVGGVSYTNLTLPASELGEVSVGAGSLKKKKTRTGGVAQDKNQEPSRHAREM